MNHTRQIAATMLMLALSLTASAEEAPATRPADAPAPDAAAARQQADVNECKITFQRLVLQCETDLETGIVHNAGPAVLECTLAAPAGILYGSVEPRITSIIDDAGHEFAKPRDPLTQHVNFNNREGLALALPFRVVLNDVPAPPRTVAGVKGEVIFKAMRAGKPFVFSLAQPGDVVAIDKISGVKLVAASRDRKRLVVGLSFEGVNKSIYDKSAPPYLLRVAILDKNNKQLSTTDVPALVPSNTEAIFRFDGADADDGVRLRVDVVTDVQELRLPLELTLKPAKK